MSTRPVAFALHSTMPSRRRFVLSSIGLTVTVVLAGCGGGDSDPPTIALSAIPTSGEAGATITLSAEVDDDDGVKEVHFYRVTSTSEELLATFTAGPYLLQTTIPTGASGTVSYRATAIDTDDQEVDSNTIEIEVTT